MQLLTGRSREWLEETHSVRFELLRHFFARFFDLDFVSTPAEWKPVLAGTLAILGPVSQLYAQGFFHRYLYLNGLADPGPYNRAVLADVLFVIAMAMAIVGIVTAMQWSSLFPALRDYLALASLPIRMRDVFLAHFAAVLSVALVFTNVMVSSPSVIFPLVMEGRHGAGSYHHMPGIYLAGSLAGWFVFFSLVAAQGLLLNVLPLRRFPGVSLFAQSAIVILLLCAIPWILTIPDLQNYMDLRPSWAFLVPPLWFLGLDQVIAGNAEPFAHELAKLAVSGTFGAMLAAIAVYLWSYRRHRVRILESPNLESSGASRSSLNFLDRRISCPREAAIFGFATRTLARSRHHRFVLAAFVALGFAICSESLIGVILRPGSIERSAVHEVAIAIPLAFSLFLLCGLRYVFRLPYELRANWIFRLSARGNEVPFRSAIEKLFLYYGVAPLGILAITVETGLLGLWAGIYVASVCILVSLILVEFLLFPLNQLPFTSAYLPGQRTPLQTAIRYAAGVVVYVWGFSSLVQGSLTSTWSKIALLFAALLIWRYLRKSRKQTHRERLFEFEEVGEPTVRTLHLDPD